MKILFLDDMEVRHQHFRMQSIGSIVTHVYDAKSAIDKLSTESFDVASLDHDLSVDTIMLMPDKGEGSGYDVALFIAALPPDRRPATVIIHSLNPAGSERMIKALEGKVEKVIRRPFLI